MNDATQPNDALAGPEGTIEVGLAPVTIRGVWRPTFLLIIASTIGTASGFLREAIVAYAYGTTASADAVALLLFGFDALNGLFASGLATYVLVPYVARGSSVDPEEPAAVSAMIVLVVAVVVVLATVGAVMAPSVVRWLGGSEAGMAVLAVELFRLAVAAFPLAALAGLAGAILQGRGYFSAVPLSRVALNVVNAALILALVGQLGAQGSAYALVAGAATQTVLLLMLVRHAKYPISLRRIRLTPQLKGIIAGAMPALLVFVLVNFALPGSERMILGLLPAGSLAASTYAWRVFYLFMAWALALQSVSFTALASQEGANDDSRSRLVLRDLRAAAFVLIPLSAGAWLFRETLVTLLFMRGRFDASSATLTTTVFGLYIASLLPVHIFGAALRYQLALRQGWRALFLAAAWVSCALLIDVALLDRLGIRAVPTGFGVSSVLVGVVGLVMLGRTLSTPLVRDVLFFAGRVAVLAAISLTPVMLWRAMAGEAVAQPTAASIAGGVAATVGAVLIYVGVGLALGMSELKPIRDRLGRMRRAA